MDKQQIEKFRKILRKIQLEIMEIFKGDAQCCGISLAQCHALIELGASGKTTISSLANELGLDKSTLSRTIDSLVQQGLVSRNISDDDRRFMSIELSERGVTFCVNINERYNEIFNEAFKDITGKQQIQFLENLELFLTVLNNVKQKGLLTQIKCCDPLTDK